MTSNDKIYAGGDIVTGAATVISAMGAGKIAASEIYKSLSSKWKMPIISQMMW